MGGLLMNIRYSKNYDKGLKELKKKHRTEQINYLNAIIDLIKNSSNFNELKKNPISYMYNFEPLKHDKNGYYSFNLSKNGGVIRLIVKPQDNNITMDIADISNAHYSDFDPKKVIYYDE